MRPPRAKTLFIFACRMCRPLEGGASGWYPPPFPARPKCAAPYRGGTVEGTPPAFLPGRPLELGAPRDSPRKAAGFPVSDWSVVTIYPYFLRLIGPSLQYTRTSCV
eukprot:8988153-Pyramimonas_sp.AAC.1